MAMTGARVGIPILLAACLGLAGCESPTLRLVNGALPADSELGAMLAESTQADARASVRIELVDGFQGAEAAFDALENGQADLAIIPNVPGFDRPNLRTVIALYPSVLHIIVREGNTRTTLRELLDGARVMAGADGNAPGLRLLEQLQEYYVWQDVQFELVDELADDPDVVFAFAPILPQRAPMFEGYELFSLGLPSEIGFGSPVDGLTLVAPMLRPFIIPSGTYGEMTPEAVTTVAIDTLLVTHRDTSQVVIYDLLQELESIGPRLASRRSDFMISRVDEFDFSAVTFPVHPGTLNFRVRNAPGFVERTAGLFDAITAVLFAIGTLLIAGYRHFRHTRKARIDEFYGEALAIRARVRAGLDAAGRQAALAEISALHDRAFDLLMREKLDPNESFQIFQGLIRELTAELRAPAS